jgi:hypothetical protein
MRGNLQTLTLLAATLATVASPAPAHADARADANKHFHRAVEMVDDGHLNEALVEFQRSYDLTSHFAVLYNIGQVLVSLARPVEAVDAYERYLAEGEKKVPAARRSEVEKEIARQKARIAELDIRVLPEGATVRVDGKVPPLLSPVRVGVGTHVVAASAEGYEPAEASVTVAGEDHRIVELVLAKVPPPPPPPEPSHSLDTSNSLALSNNLAPRPRGERQATQSVAGEGPAPEPHRWSRLRIAAIATAAVGAAGLITGGICWATAKSRHDQAVDYWYDDEIPKANARQGEADDYLKAANISFIAGGALVATGVVLYIVGGEKTRITPAVGPGFAGLATGGTW